MTFEEALDKRLAIMREIMLQRQVKYGPSNIQAAGIHGLIVRMRDKLARIEHEHKHCLLSRCYLMAEAWQSKDESWLDAYVDLANYAGVIAPMLLMGEWGLPLEDA